MLNQGYQTVNNAKEIVKPVQMVKHAILVLKNRIDFIIELKNNVNVKEVINKLFNQMITFVKNVSYIKVNVLKNVLKILFMILQKKSVLIKKYQYIEEKKLCIYGEEYF